MREGRPAVSPTPRGGLAVGATGPSAPRRRRMNHSVNVPAAAVVVEPADEDVGELAIHGRPIVGQVARPAVRDVRVAVDGQDLVVGLPGARLVGSVEPGRDDRGAADDGFAERIEGIAHVRAEQVADGDRIVQAPGIDVADEPRVEGSRGPWILRMEIVGSH